MLRFFIPVSETKLRFIFYNQQLHHCLRLSMSMTGKRFSGEAMWNALSLRSRQTFGSFFGPINQSLAGVLQQFTVQVVRMRKSLLFAMPRRLFQKGDEPFKQYFGPLAERRYKVMADIVYWIFLLMQTFSVLNKIDLNRPVTRTLNFILLADIPSKRVFQESV